MNNNVKIIIDAGHGGIDSGAVGNDLLEKDLNLISSLYIYDRLNELQIPATLTREDDSYLPRSERIKKVISLTDSPNTILISNHINAGGAEGAEVVYSLKNNSTFADLILDNIGEQGQIKRKVYQRRLPENPNKDYYYILRESGNVEPVLIEYGFIDNEKDAKKLKNDITKYAEGVVKAITEYIGYNYIPPSSDTYIVKEGDTLYSIASKNNISVDELKRINNLNTNTIYKGQVLLLKNNPKEITIYIVEKGDSLYKIANEYNTTIEELKKLNNLHSNEIYIGDELKVPKTKDQSSEYDIYIVQKGDSLWNIAKRYEINVNELITINNLSNQTLSIDQELLVPKQEDFYIVQKGDTLWSIAKRLNITVDKLKELNNLNSNLLSIGDKIKTK